MKKKPAEILDKLFDDVELNNLSQSELDSKLEEIGIDPKELVDRGLKKVRLLLSKKQKGTTVIPMRKNTTHLMAAKKKSGNLDDLKKKLNGLDS